MKELNNLEFTKMETDIEDYHTPKWDIEDASKILELSHKTVYSRARTRRIRGTIVQRNRIRGTYTKGLALLYSDADIESMRVDLRGRQQKAKK